MVFEVTKKGSRDVAVILDGEDWLSILWILNEAVLEPALAVAIEDSLESAGFQWEEVE